MNKPERETKRIEAMITRIERRLDVVERLLSGSLQSAVAEDLDITTRQVQRLYQEGVRIIAMHRGFAMRPEEMHIHHLRCYRSAWRGHIQVTRKNIDRIPLRWKSIQRLTTECTF